MKNFNVNVLVSPEYLAAYENTHPSLGTDLMTIALALEASFNTSTLARSNGYSIAFEIFTPVDNPFLAKMGPQICEGSITTILDLLNSVNNFDNTHHYILLLPCPSLMYTEVFNSVGVDVPIIDYTTNIECSKRIAVFYEANYQQLLSSFSNALLKIMNAPPADYNTVTQSSLGDEGLKVSITINDNTIYSILNSKCFLNAR
ncbi:hypothetical protein GINT2_000022 [Glugoides intestinalis]